MNDNATPMAAAEYDKKINNTIPYYSEFYTQTLDVIEQCGYSELDWLDLGCGTGTLEEKVLRVFPSTRFVAIDPSEKMLEQARNKLAGYDIEYMLGKSSEINFADRFNVVTAIKSHHYMSEEVRHKLFSDHGTSTHPIAEKRRFHRHSYILAQLYADGDLCFPKMNEKEGV